MDNDVCKINHQHPQNVQLALDSMPNEQVTNAIAQMFKLLSDPTRLKIVLALLSCELCVCDISAVVGITQSAASHQLRILRQERLARFRKDGKQTFYSIDDDHVENMIKMASLHSSHD